MQTNESPNNVVQLTESMKTGFSRRKFLGIVGASSILLATAASCKKHPHDDDDSVDLGSGDPGILNYAYALEQLEAAFYIQVVTSPYAGMTMSEMSYLSDVRNHEVAHREFFKAALGSAAIRGLTPNFSTINFADRTSVLGTAKAFEDLGVTAYNGAGKLLVNVDYLTLAGKIVSVEARHAATIRDMINPGTFADSTALDMNALDGARTPNEVLAIAGMYIKEKINASHLPTS
ncbi:MAG: ferritin-like domain-containing protein [Ginsengibacter sp.]